jgi:hypothetical protein
VGRLFGAHRFSDGDNLGLPEPVQADFQPAANFPRRARYFLLGTELIRIDGICGKPML